MLDAKKVGMKIASLRKGRGYSQEKLADMLCISPQAISKWENGHSLPETSLLPALSRIFHCSIDEMIMPAYRFDEKIEREEPTVIERQAEHIAKYVVNKIEEKLKKKEFFGMTDDEIADAVVKIYPLEDFTIQREKESRSDGKISTKINISSPRKNLKLIELIYHKRPDEFKAYALLNGKLKEFPQIYHIDPNKKLILLDDWSESYFRCDYDGDNENGAVTRGNYPAILRAVSRWHGTFWEAREAFAQLRLPWHFETKENMLAWINNAMERPFQKYRKDEESGKVPQKGVLGGANGITQKEMSVYGEALTFLKTEYIKLVEERFNAGKNITLIHGDLHPGQICLSKSPDRKVLFTRLQGIRQGLCTEDLAMLIALHISSDDLMAKTFQDTRPFLDFYYQCLSEKVKDYSYETFMNDYKISVAENLFFPIRLINRGIFDFRMRDKAIRAFEIFVSDQK